MKWLQSLKDRFRATQPAAPVILTVSETVRYAGSDNDAATDDGSFEFGIEMDVNGEAVWLPCITAQPAVIKALKDMQTGQPFTITHEESCGGMGTRINGIQIQIGGDNPAPVESKAPQAPAATEPHRETAADISALRPAHIRKRAGRTPA
jgi:hypothetical protein